MRLSLGYDIARSALAATSERTAIVSENLSRVGDANATRKIAQLTTIGGGGVIVSSVVRAADDALLAAHLRASSAYERQNTVVTALDSIDRTIADPELGMSPAAAMGRLSSSLQKYAAEPQNIVVAQAALAAAQDMAGALNAAARVAQDVRQRADRDLNEGVLELNRLLERFEAVNTEIVKGTRTEARDLTTAMDERDGLLRQISGLIEVRSITTADNDMALFLKNGVTLFETIPREVTFIPSGTLVQGVAGNPLIVDGVPLTGTTGGGRLSGLLEVRDNIVPTYNRQLDEIARGLVEAFAEQDQSLVPALPDRPGLFTSPLLAGAIPPSGTAVDGLAMTLRVNPNVDPAQGGDVTRLRDGGISDPLDPAYDYNPNGFSGFNERLTGLIDALSENRSFDAAAGIGNGGPLRAYATQSAGWLSELRQTASAELETRSNIAARSAQVLSSKTGVNLDEQLSLMLDLERSYQASSRLVATIDQMYQYLLRATE